MLAHGNDAALAAKALGSGGGSALRDPNLNRKAYIDALVAADKRDLGPLLAFARSGSQ
jgi:hypothetical protein